MGNNNTTAGAAATGKGQQRRSVASAQELEQLRARKRVVLDFLDTCGVPVNDQDETCKILVNAGIYDQERLGNATAASLTNLGIKSDIRELIMTGKDRLLNSNNNNNNMKKKQPPVKADNKKKFSIATPVPAARTTKFIKGEAVEHYREADHLIRKGTVVGVHLDDMAQGVYYTVRLDEFADGREVQSAEKKLELPGVWAGVLKGKGISPIYKEEEEGQEPQKEAQVQQQQTSIEDDEDIL